MASKYVQRLINISSLAGARVKLIRPTVRCLSTTNCLNSLHGENEKKTNMMIFDAYFGKEKGRTKENFIELIDNWKKKKFKTGEIEFIYAALRRMKDYNLEEDREIYKKLLCVLPRFKMVPENFIQSETMYYPRHQHCIVDLLMYMEESGVIPDREMEELIEDRFGERSLPMRRYLRMMYWIPKFKYGSPWLLPKPVPKDPQALAQLGISRMCTIDLESKVDTWHTSEIEDCEEKTWVVNGQSPTQMKLLAHHQPKYPIYLEGGFKIFLRKSAITYFVLRADIPPNRRRRPLKDIDVIKNLKIPFFDPPDRIDVIPKFSVHEQKDGIIYAIGATGSSSKTSLIAWLRLLEKHGNPHIANIPIIFNIDSPLGHCKPIEGIEEGPEDPKPIRLVSDK